MSTSICITCGNDGDCPDCGLVTVDARVTSRYTRIDPMIAMAAPYRTAEYSIYYCAPVADPTTWVKRHSSSFATYEQALRALKRLGWLHGNGMHHCIIPAVAETLGYPIGLELLYGRAA